MTQDAYPAFSAILPYHHAENILIEDVLASSNQMVPHYFFLDGSDLF
jgi:hypothetical protein